MEAHLSPFILIAHWDARVPRKPFWKTRDCGGGLLGVRGREAKLKAKSETGKDLELEFEVKICSVKCSIKKCYG